MQKRPVGLCAVQPVMRYANPSYPDAEKVRLLPSLLHNIPKRWHHKPAVCAALCAVLALGLDGCAPTSAPQPPPTQGQPAPQPTPSQRPALSVPVFEFGNGMGSFGCVSVAPPVFLSEEEAAHVIREEALRYGVSFGTGKTVSSQQLPYTDIYGFVSDRTARGETYAGDISLDGYDEALKLGFEFVSVEDVRDWQQPNPQMMSSVSVYDTNGTAQRLSNALSDVVIFYDPTAADDSLFNFEFDWEAEYTTEEEKYQAYQQLIEQAQKKYEEQGREASLKALREQVIAFLEWLKGQGVI